MLHYSITGKPFPLELAVGCVPRGWADLVKRAYESLPDGSTISQIKEKYGTLRFYCDPSPDVIDEIERLSAFVCAVCGEPGKTRFDRSWYETLCDKCNDT